ncbi:hypothetical protein [Maricaulis sp.]|uniref:hypothetical protein n=1 Tax=Maricaulis sp. TaxID=1486257 RepID=UPI002613113C|nr:hypothetical protein [Maricaulis sp.]
MLKQLDQLHGCRLESVRFSKTSISMELERMSEGAFASYEFSIAGMLLGAEGEQLENDAACAPLISLLECEIEDAQADTGAQTLAIRFVGGSTVHFSADGLGSDNVAILRDKQTADWLVV